MKKISSTLAARHMAAIVLEVNQGEEYVFTSHGRPVALLVRVPEGVDVTQIEESPHGKPKKATNDGA